MNKQQIKEILRPIIKEILQEKQWSRSSLKGDSKSRQDLTKHGKTLGNYIEKNYQDLMKLAGSMKVNDVIKKLEAAKKQGYSVSDQYLKKTFDNMKKARKPEDLQYHITNILMAASGLRKEIKELVEATDLLDMGAGKLLATQYSSGGKGNLGLQLSKGKSYIQIDKKEAMELKKILNKWA